MTSAAKRVINKTFDALEKYSSPGTRAGNLVERVGKMDRKGVPRGTIAHLMTERSRIGKTWTAADVGVLSDAYRESESRALVTSTQATALMEECSIDETTAGLAHSAG